MAALQCRAGARVPRGAQSRVAAARPGAPLLAARPLRAPPTRAARGPAAPRAEQQQQQQAAAPPPPLPAYERYSPPAGEEYVEATAFRIERVSFGAILTPVGLGLLSYGFGAFFQLLPGGDASALLLIYGFPISLLGFALSYAQLAPAPCRSTAAAVAARDAQATDIQKQVREDVTRFRYGDEQHLEEALQRVFALGRQGGLPRRLCPRLVGLREELDGGRYALVLEFESPNKEQMGLAEWAPRLDKFTSFFGPGVVAKLAETAAGADVALVADGSGAGRGGGEKKDVLPPLMPGLPARSQ